MYMDPLEGVPRHKDLLQKLRRDPETLKRLRKEVELLLEEQLIDHDVKPQAVGLVKPHFDDKMAILEQERQQMIRKHANFADIRAVSNSVALPFHLPFSCILGCLFDGC